MKKALLLLCILPALLFAGCARKQQGTELTYMLWGTPGEVGTVQKVLGAYCKENPNVAIKVIHAVDYNRKLNTMIAGGTPPDVFYVNASDLQYYASKGALLEIQSLIERDAVEVNLRDFFPVLVEAFRWQGRLYGLPKDFT
ncbi:MAG: extracellular solute-binding protein, partial [bacterium]